VAPEDGGVPGGRVVRLQLADVDAGQLRPDEIELRGIGENDLAHVFLSGALLPLKSFCVKVC
jgi:hypothetical protein